jgi:hypothetical protein
MTNKLSSQIDPRFLCPLSSAEFVEPPPPNKIPGYATVIYVVFLTYGAGYIDLA